MNSPRRWWWPFGLVAGVISWNRRPRKVKKYFLSFRLTKLSNVALCFVKQVQITCWWPTFEKSSFRSVEHSDLSSLFVIQRQIMPDRFDLGTPLDSPFQLKIIYFLFVDIYAVFQQLKFSCTETLAWVTICPTLTIRFVDFLEFLAWSFLVEKRINIYCCTHVWWV